MRNDKRNWKAGAAGIAGAAAVVALTAGSTGSAPAAAVAVPAPPVIAGVECPVRTSTITAQGFADVTGIPGDSTDSRHRRQIDITSLEFCVTNANGRVATLHDVGIGKSIDSATAPLLLAAESGRTISKAVITLSKGTGDRQFVFLTLTLTNVRVTSSSQALIGGEVGEKVKLTSGRASLTISKPDGGSSTTACFDFNARRQC